MANDDEPRDWETLRSDAIEAANKAKTRTSRAEVERIVDAVLAVIDEEATRRYCEKLIDDTHLRMMDFRDGGEMEIHAAEDAVLGWVGAARALVKDAPNYAESVMEFGLAGDQRYAFTVQKIGKFSPHQARMAAEAERAGLRAATLALAEEWEGDAAELDRDIVQSRKSHCPGDWAGAITDEEIAGRLRSHAAALRKAVGLPLSEAGTATEGKS